MKLYVVTSGSYSDYGINCIFLSEEKANQYVDRVTRTERYPNDVGIEEWETADDDADIVNFLKRDTFLFRCFWSEYHRTVSCTMTKADPDEGINVVTKVLTPKFVAERNTYMVVVEAKDNEHAQKIALDKIAQFRAEEAGIA